MNIYVIKAETNWLEYDYMHNDKVLMRLYPSNNGWSVCNEILDGRTREEKSLQNAVGYINGYLSGYYCNKADISITNVELINNHIK
jgi:hypothetical protein